MTEYYRKGLFSLPARSYPSAYGFNEEKPVFPHQMTSPTHSVPESYYDSSDTDLLESSLEGSPGGGRGGLTSRPGAPDLLALSLACKNNDRESRKKAEKQRRTVLNTCIGELASLVPLVAESSRKIDKTGILRLAAHDLRKEHIFGDSIKPCHMEISYGAAETLLNIVGGFMLSTTTRGIIVVVSSNIHSYLGHSQIDLLGQNILSITHPDDVPAMKLHLTPSDPGLANRCITSGGACAATISHSPTLKRERREFYVRLLRAGARSDGPQYSVCRVEGSFRVADRAGIANESNLIRRQRVRRDRAVSPSGNDVIFVGVARVMKQPIISKRLLEASKQEYWTRHLVDGRIVNCDQRISIVAGYMAEEVQGSCAFTFMHKEDVRWVAIALRQMYDDSKPYGESCYRLISRTGRFMYLRTKGFLEIDKVTKEAQSFLCINTLLKEEDGVEMIREMKKQYSAMIDLYGTDEPTQIKSEYPDNETGVEDIHQVEQVIIHMISDLPSGGRHGTGSLSDLESLGSAGSPAGNSLTIIPPTASSVKSSIEKSLSVVSLSHAFKRSSSNPPSDDEFCPTTHKRSRPNVILNVNGQTNDYG